MARGAMPWTIRIEEFLADGEWHEVAEVVKVGAVEIPRERALKEMGESRSVNADEDRRAEAGASTLARQALMAMRRFGKAEFSSDKRRVRRVSDASVSLGVLAERVTLLEDQVVQLSDTIVAMSGVSLPLVTSESETAEILDDPEALAAIAEGETDDRVRDSAPGTVRVGNAGVDLP